ncbi:penicillin-binding transpeptidase domain-containing protein [Paenibacillus dokdonensis]|uniref:penicillin-binding protein PBP4(5) n=1 Tax=Paenibacillus dokdonensis TaxID=2567944 RepID=UPI001457A01B|nr:penicillin-binding transpeptidase domain-containing protein [Paenibacillus dokdonensis]
MKPKQMVMYGILSFLAASVLALYVYFFGRLDEQSPNETVQTYMLSLRNQDYEQLYDLMSTESLEQSDMSREQFVQKYKSIFEGMGVTKIEVNAGTPIKLEDSSNYMLDYSAILNTWIGQIHEKYQLILIQEKSDKGKPWKIQWMPSLILPDMAKGDKVSVKILKPERGEITDRDGYALATRVTAYEWGITPSKLGGDPDAAIGEISNYFHIPADAIKKKLAQKWVKPEYFVPVMNIDDPQIPDGLPGVSIHTKEVRSYPLGEAAAHLTGYVRQVTQEDLQKDKEGYYQADDWIGKSGLEQSMETQLRGQKGGSIEVIDEQGKSKSIIAQKPAVNGQTIKLTIRSEVQQALYDTLSSDAGAAVMMDPVHGDLLALVSTPSYNPNKMVRGLSQSEWDSYSQDPTLPFFNRFTNRYAPGSVFKAVTAAAGLTEKVTTPEKTHHIQGLHWRKDDSWGGYYVTRVKDAASVNMVDALVYSDNIYFAQEALEMGSQKFIEGIRKFGFEENFNLAPLYLKPSQYANKNHLNLDSEVLLADTSYGQGEMLMSPIHLAASFTPFVNDGKMIKPVLFANQEDEAAVQQIITPEVANTVKSSLIQVVKRSSGTAHALSFAKRNLAAKTGTAELKSKKGETGQENGFLVAFDVDSSSYLLTALVENVNGRGGSHYVVNKLRPFLEKY